MQHLIDLSQKATPQYRFLEERGSLSDELLRHRDVRVSGNIQDFGFGMLACILATATGPFMSGKTTSLMMRGIDPLYCLARAMAWSPRPACSTM
jgi:hypothetical protein